MSHHLGKLLHNFKHPLSTYMFKANIFLKCFFLLINVDKDKCTIYDTWERSLRLHQTKLFRKGRTTRDQVLFLKRDSYLVHSLFPMSLTLSLSIRSRIARSQNFGHKSKVSSSSTSITWIIDLTTYRFKNFQNPNKNMRRNIIYFRVFIRLSCST